MIALSLLLSAALAGGAGGSKPAVPVVTVHAKDYAFVGPKSIKAGTTTFRLVNDGKELHHLSNVKLAKGKTMKDLAEALKKPGPPPAWLIAVGGPNPAVPGSSVEAMLSLDAGEYAFL